MTDRNIVNKPWGYEEIFEMNEAYAFKKLFMEAGHSCSLQYHNQKLETIYVVSGILEIEVNGEKKTFYKGMSVTIRPKSIHRMTAVEDSVYLEASTPHLDDVVRLQDSYGRI